MGFGAGASRSKYAHLYQSPDWTAVSKLQRSRFPFCEWPECKRMAGIADHIIPAEIFIEMCRGKKRFLFAERAFFYMGNLQSLCRECHGLKTEADKKHIASGEPWIEIPRRAPKKWSF